MLYLTSNIKRKYMLYLTSNIKRTYMLYLTSDVKLLASEGTRYLNLSNSPTDRPQSAKAQNFQSEKLRKAL